MIMCQESRWDYNEEWSTGAIPDSGIIGYGTRLQPDPLNAVVERARIFIDIIHEVPTSLDINMIHEYYILNDTIHDTIFLWDNDYPGDIQEIDLEQFENLPVDGSWEISIHDELADSNSGLLNEFVLMIEYK